MLLPRPISVIACALFLTGCASAQLNYNTLDIAESVGSLYVRQALINLSRTIDNPTSIPSQIEIAAGSVQTSNSITPSINEPLTKAITSSGTGAVTSTVLAGSALNIGASNGWQQNWTISPITDGDNLRNLRALYRYVVVGSNLREEYRPPLSLKNDKYVFDPYALQQPHCVLCTAALIPNRKLHTGWLYWTSDNPSVPARLPPEGVEIVDLGHWGKHELFMSAESYQRGYLSDFVLFVMGVGAGPTETAAAGGKGGGGGGAASKRYELIIPQQIQPQMQ
jgi:hypothetical protein